MKPRHGSITAWLMNSLKKVICFKLIEQVLAKKEQKKEAVYEVRTRSETAMKPSKKNRKLGDLY